MNQCKDYHQPVCFISSLHENKPTVLHVDLEVICGDVTSFLREQTLACLASHDVSVGISHHLAVLVERRVHAAPRVPDSVDISLHENFEEAVVNVRSPDIGLQKRIGDIICLGNAPIVCVELLLEYGANVDAIDCDGNSLLGSFVKQNNIPVTELLLKNGAAPNIRDELGRTPIFYVRNEAMLKLLLEHGAHANVAPTLPDDDPLLLSIPEELILAVVEAGADINLRNEDGRSVLYLCLKKIVADETFTRINILIEQGADPNLPDNTGDTPLQLFIRYYSYRYPNPLEIHKRFPEKVLRLGESMIEHGGCIDPQDDSWKNFFKDNVKRPLTEYLLQLYEHRRMFGRVLDEDLEEYAR